MNQQTNCRPLGSQAEIKNRLLQAIRLDNYKKLRPLYQPFYFPEDKFLKARQKVLNAEKRDDRCKAHALYTEAINLARDAEKKFILSEIFEVIASFSLNRPKANSYKVWHEKTWKRIIAEGVFEVLRPKPSYGNKSSDERLRKLALEYLIDERKFRDKDITEFINHHIEEEKAKGNPDYKRIKAKSREWVRDLRQANQSEVDYHREGKSANRNRFRTPIKNAKVKAAMDRWEMDGSVITIPYWDLTKNRARTITICIVVDCYSGMIIGFSFGKTEKADLYIRALKMAFTKAGSFPFELVYDRFPGNDNEDAQPFLKRLKKEGVFLNMNRDGNPRHKPIVEGTVNGLCELARTYHNFVGKNITTVDKNSRRSPEYVAKVTRSPFGNGKSKKKIIIGTDRRCLLYDEAISSITQLVTEYNSRSKNKETINRISKFNQSQKVNAIPFDDEKMVWLFDLESDRKVENGRIIFYKRHEENIIYLIPGAVNQLRYSGQVVKVRYTEHNLDNGKEIYVYDLNDDFLFTCLPQSEINVNAVDRTPEDYAKRVEHASQQREKEMILLNPSKQRRDDLIEMGVDQVRISNNINASKEQLIDDEEAFINGAWVREEYGVQTNMARLKYAKEENQNSNGRDIGCEIIERVASNNLDRYAGYEEQLPLQ